MQEILNKITLWLREVGVSSKITTHSNGFKCVNFEVCLPDHVFIDKTNVLTVNIIPYFRDAKYGLRVLLKENKSMFLAQEKESIREICKSIYAKYSFFAENNYDSKYDSMFIEGWNVLCSKWEDDISVSKIISSKEAATKFFKDEKEVLKELLAQAKELVNLDCNSDSFYQIFYPNMDKAEVDSFFKDMVNSMCEKPPKKLIGFVGNIPTEIKEQREVFTDLLKGRILFLKLKEILGK